MRDHWFHSPAHRRSWTSDRRPRPHIAAGAAVLAAIVIALTASGLALAFSDTGGSPYATAIDELASRNIITGFEDGTFRPDAAVSRQQFAKMIVKTLELTVTGTEVCPFSDVDAQVGVDPFYPSKYVAVCADHSITVGFPGGVFKPFDNITRQQLITMVARGAGLPEPPADYRPGFSEGQFYPADHYLNARKAAHAGLLEGLQGVGPAYDFFVPASRGECAQLLWNLLQMKRSLLPRFADLAPVGPVGYSFQIHTEAFKGVEKGPSLNYSENFKAETVDGHLTLELVAIEGSSITVKLVVDELDIPVGMGDAGELEKMVPISARLTMDDQGRLDGVFVSAAGEPEEAVDEELILAVAPIVSPFVKALLAPYSGRLATPGDSVNLIESPMQGDHKMMDVDSTIEFVALVDDLAGLEYDLAVTDIDIPIDIDIKPALALLGYPTDFGDEEWMMQGTLGTEILASGSCDLDVTTGLPTTMTLESTMQLDIRDVDVPDELKILEPRSNFFQGRVTWAYIHPMKASMTLTRD